MWIYRLTPTSKYAFFSRDNVITKQLNSSLGGTQLSPFQFGDLAQEATRASLGCLNTPHILVPPRTEKHHPKLGPALLCVIIWGQQ
jgi:hypothetical protein